MSEHEALMWNIEKDPWLNPSGASLTILDRPLDMDRFRPTLRASVAKTPRLYQRVVPGFARMSTPAWVPDAEFDLDAHLREIVLPAPGSTRQLLDLAAQLYSEPLDRTRPLWRFVVIGGLEGNRSALWVIIHHAISDGIGQLRIAELYQQITRDDPAPPDVDLEGIIAEAAAAHSAKEAGGDMATTAVSNIRASTTHLARRQVGISRRLLGEVAMWPADPSRIGTTVGNVRDTVRGAASQLRPSNDEEGEAPTGSPLLSGRSRHRRFEWVSLRVDDLKKIGKLAGGTINDAFLAGLTEAAHRYHLERGIHIAHVNSSFVLSTRKDGKAGGNAFTPVPVRLPAGPMEPAERVAAVIATLESAKDEAQRTGGMTGLSGVINLLPTSVVTSTARSAAARIDFATSNLRGAPFPIYVSGSEVMAAIPMGPVAGTGANITALSMNGQFDIGIFVDPAAFTDPESFRDDIESSFADFLAACD
ncbi:wax ester/triacylglycerol synthase domain-containing protein [Ilumatobacter nonamiensis]|uniref:wax ester/triacylglycerol synthase domain-containing protein n=1 Tax=Ilumatobacter nonamiensis TaxID=467093 RepID=UPI00034547A9|nr:wax ester/triacylglycerol synthase domain-containing protein [Ilumatobacter nonamiensis]